MRIPLHFEFLLMADWQSNGWRLYAYKTFKLMVSSFKQHIQQQVFYVYNVFVNRYSALVILTAEYFKIYLFKFL